jgi:hypothetical protein
MMLRPLTAVCAQSLALDCKKNIAYFLTYESDVTISVRSDYEARSRERPWQCFHAQ